MSPLTLVSHSDCLAHHVPGHPESPERLLALRTALLNAPLAAQITWLDAPLASKEQLARVHSAEHIQRLFSLSPPRAGLALDPDTILMPATLTAALRAAGAVVAAVDQTLLDQHPAFCAVRPPGHHAEHDRAMGFCFFNNLAVGVAHALTRPNIQRIAIVDFDVHHGNGSDDIFAGHPSVTLFSSYQHPFYPGTAPSTPFSLPLPAGSDGRFALQQIKQHWLEPLRQLQPDMVFFSAGFDAHQDDFLAGLNWTTEDYHQLTRSLIAATRSSCQGRYLSVLEGGYQLTALADSALAHLQALADWQQS